MIYVTGYTPDYREQVTRLLCSLAKFNLPALALPYSDLGDWRSNTYRKPHLLIQAHLAFPEVPLVWLDADAEVVRPPEWPEVPEIGLHLFRWFPKRRLEYLSGTLYLPPIPVRLAFLRGWCNELSNGAYRGDQNALPVVIDRFELSVTDLPRSLCQIVNAEQTDGPPSIVHYQASRQKRNRK